MKKTRHPVHDLTLKIADLMGECGQPPEVQLFALLTFAAHLVSEADEPEEAGTMALMSFSKEIRAAQTAFDS